jgi:hypothetical protein
MIDSQIVYFVRRQTDIIGPRFIYGYQVVNIFPSWQNKDAVGLWCDNINNMVEGRENFSGTTNSDICLFFTKITISTTVFSLNGKKSAKYENVKPSVLSMLSARKDPYENFSYTAFFPTLPVNPLTLNNI